MNLDRLRDIIRLFEESGLSELSVKDGEERVRMKRARPEQAAAVPRPAAQPFPAQAVSAEGPDFNRIVEVKSPLVGVYYEAAEPGGKPFVQVGDRVAKGDVLCLIEVMKQVTEVTAPQDGQVADICVANGSVVEFGQTLIKLC